VVVTTGAIRRAKLQSNRHHHQQTNTQFLQAGCPSCHQATVSEHWRKIIIYKLIKNLHCKSWRLIYQLTIN